MALEGNIETKAAMKTQSQRSLREIGSVDQIHTPFHWPVEFPEVFSQHAEGFDCIVGNPPWGAITGEKYKRWLTSGFDLVGDYETAMAFVEQSKNLCRPKATISLVLPNTILLNDSAKKLRSYIAERTKVEAVIDLTNQPIFRSASVRCCVIFVTTRKIGDGDLRYSTSIATGSVSELRIPQSTIKGRSHWAGLDQPQVTIPTHLPKLDDLFFVKQGYKPYDKHALVKRMSKEDAEAIVRDKPWHADAKLDDTFVRELKGRDVAAFNVAWSGLWASYGPWVSNYIDPAWFDGDRVLVREIVGIDPYLIIASRSDDQFVHNPSIICVKQRSGQKLHGILELYLNSSIATEYIKAISAKASKGMFPKVLVKDLRALPFPDPHWVTEHDIKRASEIRSQVNMINGRKLADEFIEELIARR